MSPAVVACGSTLPSDGRQVLHAHVAGADGGVEDRPWHCS